MSPLERPYAPRYGRRPVYQPIRALAASAFVAGLATDFAYWLTADFPWVDFSDWLISAGAVLGFLALIVGVFELIVRRSVLAPRPVGALLLDLVAWALGVLNMLMHTRDAWTSVVPWGLALSALTVVVLILSEVVQRSAPAPAVVERVA